MTKIKICGLRRTEDILYANEFKPDYIGFVFASDRKRYIAPEAALKLKSILNPDIKSVGVFVNESPDTVKKIARSGVMDCIQLHGGESEEYIKDLKNAFPEKPVIKAFRVESEESIKTALNSSADYILFDNGIGGTGRAFDWSLIKNADRPFFLAGGLTADNIGEAIKKYRPFAVDISSGVESGSVKDRNKIKIFIDAVKNSSL